ncbi:uncharacterized protein LOC113494085 [Trichoplusia ni]|uniref:Uncharacterized protein LOC113494085 n=1 Tax=Trichoplusia ni TaxID=7111 RepID=A0A7E5VI78_TRINI|nr:uncharacterized protein LOC113494085 [Trichoplusia ni]
MVSFDITSLFTNVPVDEVIQIITTLLGGTTLPTGYVESITYCLKSGYFLWRGDFYLQIDGVAMGSPLAPVVANIFMEWFEEKALESANVKPRYWWRYVDDIFAVVARDSLKDLTSHLNRVHAKIEVTIEEEKEGKLPFLDVLVIREPNGRVTHTVYRKPTHTDRYLRADSHHHPSHLSSVPRTLLNRALALCDHDYVNAELRHSSTTPDTFQNVQIPPIAYSRGVELARCRASKSRRHDVYASLVQLIHGNIYIELILGRATVKGRGVMG